MHTCCAPCLVYVQDKLEELKVDYDVFFYNPNIHPIMEHERRLKTLVDYTQKNNLELIIDPEFQQGLWTENFKCVDCYNLRFEKTAKTAKEMGYKVFCTTLLVSIYQDHEEIIKICEQVAKKYDIDFFYYDFREGFRQGQKKAADLGLYRQKYCGCINSYNKSKFKDKIRWD